MPRKPLTIAGVAALVVLASVGLVFAFGAAGAQSQADSPADRTITVSATGQAEASPDQAVVRLAVTATGNDSAEVRDELSAGAEDLRNRLDDLGVEYETSHYGIHEDRRHREPARPGEKPAGDATVYRGQHGVTVTLDDPDRVGEVIDAAANAGAEVDDVRLTLSDEKRTDLREDAIKDAMADARSQADTVALAGDLSVTNVATVDASERRYRPVAYETAAGGDGGGSTSIDLGAVSVSYNVQVTYNATTA